MMLSVLLLLLQLVSRTQAGVFGFHYRYITKDFQGAGYQVVRYDKFGFGSSLEYQRWLCKSSCSHWVEAVDVCGEACQFERPLFYNNESISYHSLLWNGANWTYNKNGIVPWTCILTVEMRNRSDIGKPNSSPQTALRPTVRVPSNCQRNISLLTFDPDGDNVQCRLADGKQGECITCTPAPVLSVFSSCTLSFSPTSSSNEGPYAVQLMMEDFPRQSITLTDYKGGKLVKTPKARISGVPVQFLLKVDPAAPSCTEGLYLPRFLPPTPEHGAQILGVVNQILEITIRAEANQSEITELFFSGPYNVVKSTSGSGNFTLSWTPSPTQVGEYHPICFVVQASFNSSVFESELRCVDKEIASVLSKNEVCYHIIRGE